MCGLFLLDLIASAWTWPRNRGYKVSAGSEKTSENPLCPRVIK